jgi:DNA polymerase V
MELQGVSCLPLSLLAPPSKGLAVTRTFGGYVTEMHELAQAVSTFAARAVRSCARHGCWPAR